MRKATMVRNGSRKLFLALICLSFLGFTEHKDLSDLRPVIQAFKKDPRGPYQGIRWFCPDGSVIPAKERCAQPGGIQHALPKKAVQNLQKEYGIYLGQILAGTPFEDFLDAEHQNSRLKQYQLEKYLRAIDDGWILRRARFYRGAFQAEDEQAWGKRFLLWLVANDDLVKSQFYLSRQICKETPHTANENLETEIRALAKVIADSLPRFMDLRVKIHGNPDASDFQRVQDFRRQYQATLSENMAKKLLLLEKKLTAFYQQRNLQSLSRYLATIPANEPVGYQLRKVLNPPGASRPVKLPQEYYYHPGNDHHGASQPDPATVRQCKDLAHLLWVIRKNVPLKNTPEMRLALLDLSNEAELLLFRMIGTWRPGTVGELLEKNYVLAKAAAACGFLEVWEWEEINPGLFPVKDKHDMDVNEFSAMVDYAQRAVEWSTGMVRAVYSPVVNLFASFEPLAPGLIDDKIRSSVLLPWGKVVSQLSDFKARYSNLSDTVFGLRGQNQIRGLNPGIAVGELAVVNGPPDGIELSADKIYVLSRAPADLKPVAGIATVSEGNAVSHVQLLARNLGIPNAVISLQMLNKLSAYSGAKVFYAVSPKGTVVMKLASEMTPEEKALVADLKRNEERITVPTDRLDLSQTGLLTLSTLRAADSGRICGPKAANLGQLSALFPDKVPPGLVIPFGVFNQHLQQLMPGKKVTFWHYLQHTFDQVNQKRQLGENDREIEKYVLSRLQELRGAIRNIAFLPGFAKALKSRFVETFGVPMGQLPIFIRSDTNMEDLKNFTGAGLNLTVANVLQEDKILQAIRDVWASPFSDRSYRWRQKYLNNPQSVYPSLLLLPSVNVDKSGVVITTGIASANPEDITVAFNRGSGGAVAGQAAETYLLRHDGRDLLLAPAREPQFNDLPAKGGGVHKRFATFENPILSKSERFLLRQLTREVRRRLPGTPGIESDGPFDVELGFWNDAIWLFQVRPFVENKLARSSTYLNALDSGTPENRVISLDEIIEAEP
ncbi:MAG: PEP/pyruvate-binding domain-containing protein [bacterium]